MKVTIITVCFNSENTIEETIKSVLSQTYENIEYIIKDGKSNDNTLQIINKYQKKYKDKIKIITGKDLGIYDAMNIGIKNATGDIIGLLNSDDIFANNKAIENIVKAFERFNCDIVYSDLVFMDSKTMSIPRRNFIAKKFKKYGGWHPPHPTFYVKKEIYDFEGLYNVNYKIASDLDFMLRVIRNKKYKIIYIQKYLVKMRSGGTSTAGLKGYLKNLKEANKILKKNNVKLPLLYNIFRIMKTCWQSISAKIFKKSIINKLDLMEEYYDK